MPDEPDWQPPEGSWASSAARRRNMQAIRSRDTKPEKVIRRLIHAKGLRYRIASRPLPDLRRTADLVFRPAKVAVFVDGCYWHGCPEHYVPPRTNPGYWSEKVARNIARDRDTDHKLTEAGFGSCSGSGSTRSQASALRRSPMPSGSAGNAPGTETSSCQSAPRVARRAAPWRWTHRRHGRRAGGTRCPPGGTGRSCPAAASPSSCPRRSPTLRESPG